MLYITIRMRIKKVALKKIHLSNATLQNFKLYYLTFFSVFVQGHLLLYA